MTHNILHNLHLKSYRFETIVTEYKNPFYKTEKKYVRNAEIYYLGQKEQVYSFQILIVDFEFSEEENAIQQLLKKISYLFDELEISVDNKGYILTVDNILFLRLRWLKIQSELVNTHQGEAISRYFNEIGSLLESETHLIEFLSGYNMFGLLFNGLMNSFDKKSERISPEGYTEIMTPEKKGDEIILKISVEKRENAKNDYVGGILKYKNGIYEEGFVEIKKENYHLKHSLLWIG